jgi:hypothetical protein
MANEYSIDTYKTKFANGFAKQYLFLVDFNFPSGNSSDFKYYVRSTSLPDSSFEEVVIPYAGISYKMAGTRNYGDWAVSFNIDGDSKILKELHKWHNQIYGISEYKHSANSPKSYMRDQEMSLINGNGNGKIKYKLYNAWPKTIGAVTLDYASSEVSTVDVTFSYQYFSSVDIEIPKKS